jgi:hypothetical protein
MLSGSELHQLGIAYEKSEAADFEPGIHERYETWALELAHRLDIRQETFVVRPACH